MLEEYLKKLAPNVIVQGPMLPEPVKIVMVQAFETAIKLSGQGLHTGQFYDPSFTSDQLALLDIVTQASYNGDPIKFRLGLEALRLQLAYEYDPYFSLSIARIDPLPHQLEAVYEYFLKLPRIRFLLADDPGAGKTIMAGLLIKELKIRGLIKRILIVTPANLTFQWKRELEDKFHETFHVIRGTVLRENYGSNPWQEHAQAITSIAWISRIADAKESLLRSHWDLVIVDEAHKMSAYSAEKKTMAYQLGEALSGLTDHYLLMTATPHKGDPENFALFLSLLDKDVYGDVKSLQEAMAQHEAPFYLRRVKEALVAFPDPATGAAQTLFTKRNVRTAEFHIDADEADFYDALTRYVEDQSIKAAQDDSLRGRAIGFIMAMLQRRFASSVYAVRRSLERMQKQREKILANPARYRQEQIRKKLPEDFDELPEDEQTKILEELEEIVASIDPHELREEILQLSRLIRQANMLQQRETETKLTRLKEMLAREGIFADPAMKLLIFTEHKDTLDYLAGDGKEGRPYGKLREWGLTVTQIHGAMAVGDRATSGTRIYAEQEFRDPGCQIMVATEAAGEGINLQFCWFMINYDIPWNPMRLEQRMGRIHRYGQEKDCLIINFVAVNTREGRVLQKLFERIRRIELDLDPQRTGKVFNVLGDIFPSNQLERMLRAMYAHNLTDEVIISRIVAEVDTERFRRITHSTLEGLAKRELNLAVMIGKTEQAKEQRLVPEVIADFFLQAAPLSGLAPKEIQPGIYRIGRIPRALKGVGSQLEAQFGRLAREYKQIAFDKALLQHNPTLEWVTPGHPLFEAVRAYIAEQTRDDLRRGAVFYDLHRRQPARIEVFAAALKDGLGHTLHERLFCVECGPDGPCVVRPPTLFLDLIPAIPAPQICFTAEEESTAESAENRREEEKEFLALRSSASSAVESSSAPAAVNLSSLGARCGDRRQAEQTLLSRTLQPWLAEVQQERQATIARIARHVDISLKTIIDRVQCQFAELMDKSAAGAPEPGLEGRISQFQDRLDDLNQRWETRLQELERERHCAISAIQHLGGAWVLPHPQRSSPEMAEMVRDDEVERIAVDAVIAYERARGWEVESVESQDRGFDLISRRPHPEDPRTAAAIRFIEVKGRAGVGAVVLSANEYKKAQLLKDEYWLYVVFHCAAAPEIHRIQNPAQLDWQPIVKIEHYQVGAKTILTAENGREKM